MSKSNNNYGRKNDKKRSFSAKKETRERKSFPTHNNLKWYDNNPQLLLAASNLPFNQVAGLPLEFNNYHDQVIDGIMTVNMSPAFTGGEGTDSVLNSIAKDQYAFIRHANSGHSNYESTDLIIAELAITQPYAYYAWMCRLYGLLNVYLGDNRYYPEAIFESINVDVKDLQTHAADFYQYICTYAAKLSQFYIPSLTLFQKMAYTYANVFKDGASNHAQVYIPTTENYYIYQPVTSSQGGRIAMTNVFPSITNITLDDIATAGNNILRPLIIDEDIGIISGDILKAYGKENCIGVLPIPQNYTVLPEFNQEFLMQLENSSITPNTSSLTNVVGQLHSPSDTYISTNLSWTRSIAAMNDVDWILAESADYSIPINMHTDNPTIQDVVEGTRYMKSVTADYDSTRGVWNFRIDLSDLFIINSVTCWKYSYSGSGSTRARTLVSKVFSTPYLTTDAECSDCLDHFACFSARPRMYDVRWDEDDEEIIKYVCLMDWDNPTLVTKTQLDNLNRVCLMSQWDFPQRKF